MPGWLLQVGREQREDTHRHIGRPTCHRLLSNVSSGQNSHYRTENTETTFIFDLLFAFFYFTLPLRQCLLIFSAFSIWHCRLTEVVQSQLQSRPVYRRWCSLCVFSLYLFLSLFFHRNNVQAYYLVSRILSMHHLFSVCSCCTEWYSSHHSIWLYYIIIITSSSSKVTTSGR